MAADASRDGWDWVDLSVRIAAGVMIPVALFVVGRQLRLERQEARNAERIRRSIHHLTSANWRERLMGVQVMWHYCQREKYPTRLVAVLASAIRTDSNPKVHRAAARLFSEIGTDSTDSRASSSQVACQADLPERSLPEIQHLKEQIRLYLHVQNENQRPAAVTLMKAIDGDTISIERGNTLRRYPLNVVSVEELDQGPQTTQLRYFASAQKPLAEQLRERARSVHSSSAVRRVDLQDLSAEMGPIPNHFELWLAPQEMN